MASSPITMTLKQKLELADITMPTFKMKTCGILEYAACIIYLSDTVVALIEMVLDTTQFVKE